MIILFNFFRRFGQRIRRSDVTPILLLTLSLILIGVFAFSRIEGWSWLDSLYVTIITISTVGYGDLSPQTVNGRIFAIFFTFIAIGVGGYAISSFAAYLIESRTAKKIKILRKRRMKRIDELSEHYILCGADIVGKRIAEEFYLAKVPFIIVEPDEHQLKTALLFSHPDYFQQKIQSMKEFEEVDLSEYEDRSVAELGELLQTPYLMDDPTSDLILMKAGVGRAKGLIAAMPDDRDNLAIVVGARALANRNDNPKLRIMARVDNGRYYSKLILSGADTIRMPGMISGLEMASHMMNPDVGDWWYSFAADLTKIDSPNLAQIASSAKPDWVGQTVTAIHQTANTVTVAVKRNGEFISPPAADLIIQADDILITLGQPIAE